MRCIRRTRHVDAHAHAQRPRVHLRRDAAQLMEGMPEPRIAGGELATRCSTIADCTMGSRAAQERRSIPARGTLARRLTRLRPAEDRPLRPPRCRSATSPARGPSSSGNKVRNRATDGKADQQAERRQAGPAGPRGAARTIGTCRRWGFPTRDPVYHSRRFAAGRARPDPSGWPSSIARLIRSFVDVTVSNDCTRNCIPAPFSPYAAARRKAIARQRKAAMSTTAGIAR